LNFLAFSVEPYVFELKLNNFDFSFLFELKISHIGENPFPNSKYKHFDNHRKFGGIMSPQFGPFKEKKSVSLKLSKMKDIYNYFLKIVNNS
jgi:hypothetical protein